MRRNIWVLIGGLIVIFIAMSLMRYSFEFLWVIIVMGIGLYIYYDLTLTPEEREKRRFERERREAERKHLEFVKKEAMAKAEGESYGIKYGWEKAKDDIDDSRRPVSFGYSPLRDSMFGRTRSRNHKRRR